MPESVDSRTGQQRCEGCGQKFNSEDELKRHRVGCLEAQQSGKYHGDKLEHTGGESGSGKGPGTP